MSEETSLDHDQTGPKTSPEPHRRIADPHRRITINILEILELPIFAYHTYYTSKHMYNWMKWLRLLGGWHFIAATAIKPPKAACQFAADDILLYKICYNIQWIYFTIWEKGKEELSPLQYHFKSLHIISRHYKKSLLRSQIYHGYEELSTDTNYPIWRRQKLPYMKKTRKKKQVCGAACFMAAEIKFSEDVRPSVRPSEAWNTLFWPVHRSVGPPDQPFPFYGMSVRPSVRPSVCPSVRPSGEVSGHLPEIAWRD